MLIDKMSTKVVISNSVDDSDWDRYVINTKAGHYSQMAIWGKVKRAQGWKTTRVMLRNEHEDIIGGVQILWKTFLVSINYGYISKGPLCNDHSLSSVSVLLRNILDVCQKQKLYYLALQPPNENMDLINELTGNGFTRSTQGNIERPATIKLSIGIDDDRILEQIRPKKRKWIRKAQRNPFTIRAGTKEDIGTFYRLHCATAKRGGFTIQSINFFHELWDIFYPRQMVFMHLCEYRGEPVSGTIVITNGDTVENYRSGWSGKYGRMFPNEALDWHIIQWAKQNGYQWYDFGGIDATVGRYVLTTGKLPEDKIDSYSAYKLHFSHNIETYPETYEYLNNPVLRYFYKSVMCNDLLCWLPRLIYQKWLSKR